MRSSLPLVAALLAVGVALPARAHGQAPTRPTARPTARLGWMAGCWARDGGGRVVEENWMPPRGGVLLGVSRTTRGDSLVEFETVRIYEAGDTLVYAAAPSGQRPAEFRAAVPRGDTTAIVFENPAHDFPQRISYRASGADSLIARIDGTRGGRARAVDFAYRRVPCVRASRPPQSAARPAPAPLPSVTLPPALDRVLRDYERHWTARDAAGLAGLFTDDGFVLRGGEPPIRGRDAIRRAYEGSGGPLVLRALAYAATDTVGYVIGAYGDRAGTDFGKFTLTLRRGGDGRWLIASDMDNPSVRPPGPPGPPGAAAP